MKKALLLLILAPTISMANLYSCNGSGFSLEIQSNPKSMTVVGNGFNTNITSINTSVTFDTVVTGNSKNPPATLKLVIKDSSFANPGDSFKGILTVSSPSGIKEYPGLICLKGND